MWIRKLQTTLLKIGNGPLGGVILAAFLIGALLIYAFTERQEITYIYQQY